MIKDIGYFNIDDKYIGFNQHWFLDIAMNKGGCGAVTACDLCIYLKKYFNKDSLFPFETNNLTKKDYVKFSKVMKPYLAPRLNGIDTLKLFIDGFSEYLKSVEFNDLVLNEYSGNNAVDDAINTVILQIDKGIPLPFLNLRHKNKELYDYEWHWFMINGYKKKDDDFMVKVVSYGKEVWLDFIDLWNSGHDKKGGMIICEI